MLQSQHTPFASLVFLIILFCGYHGIHLMEIAFTNLLLAVGYS